MGSNFTEGQTYRYSRAAFEDTALLYNWVIDGFRQKTLVERGSQEAEVPLRLSFDQDYLRLMTGESFSFLMEADRDVADVVKTPELPAYVNAPVKKGDAIGELVLTLDGEELARVPLLASESVEASVPLLLLDSLKQFTQTFVFKFAAILIVLLFVLYIVLMILRRRRRNRRNYRPKRRV
jgi:D-alanyl-D-alanine carboxypeptidase (penicillin-binding protein 5/6)